MPVHKMYPPSGPYLLTTGRYKLWCTCGFNTQHYVYPRLALKMWERHVEQVAAPVKARA